MVAIMIFATVAGAMTRLLMRNVDESFNNKARVTAINLAERELELLRQYDEAQLASLGNLRRNDVTINNTKYSVDLVARWVPTAQTGDAPPPSGSKCAYGVSASRTKAYVRADATVSWKGMTSGSVTSSTLIRPATTAGLTGSGYAVADITRPNGSPVSNRLVTFTGGSPSITRTTYSDSNGCAFFAYAPYGTYTFRVGDPSTGQLVVLKNTMVNSSTYGSITPINYS